MTPILRVKPYTKASVEHLLIIQNTLRAMDAAQLQGDIVQCGVWKGGQIILARLVSPHRRCWLFDTFTGMTEPQVMDVKPDGWSAIERWKIKKARGENWDEVGIKEVKKNLIRENVYSPDHFEFVIGDVCETLKQTDLLPPRIAFLHLDTDWYASTKMELEILYPRLVSGGTLIIDDYGHWLGARLATDEYFKNREPDYLDRMIAIDYTAIKLIKI